VTGVRICLLRRHLMPRVGIGRLLLLGHLVASVRVNGFRFRRHLMPGMRIRLLLGRRLVACMLRQDRRGEGGSGEEK
jgi:hypothetical protein